MRAEGRAVVVEILGGQRARTHRETRLATMELVAVLCSILM
jgi:hypothetical protein